MIFSWLLISSNEEDVWLESKLCQILIELPQCLRWPLCYVMLHYMPRSTVLTWEISNIQIHFLALELGEIKVTFHVNLCKCRNLKCWSYGQQGADATSALLLWDFCCIWAQVTLIPFNLWRWPEPPLIPFSLSLHTLRLANSPSFSALHPVQVPGSNSFFCALEMELKHWQISMGWKAIRLISPAHLIGQTWRGDDR